MFLLAMFFFQISQLLDLPIKQVVEIIPISVSKTLIAHNTEPDVLSLFDTETGENLGTVIRKGKGPGEAKQIDAMAIDSKTGMLYVCADYSKLMVFNKDFKLVSEKQLQTFANSISISPNTIIVGLKSHLVDFKQESVPAAFVIDKKSLVISDTLLINTECFEFKKVNQISLIQNIPIYTNVTVFNNTLFVSVSGFSLLFRYDIGKKSSKPKIIKLPELNFNFKVVNKKGIGAGLQIPSVCISSTKISESEFLLSYGNIYQEMPYGYYKISIPKDQKDIVVTKKDLQDFPEKKSSYTISAGITGLFIFDNFHSFANSVYFMKL